MQKLLLEAKYIYI